MAFPIKVCSICSEEFELRPGKPGYANRCPSCTESEAATSANKGKSAAKETADSELNSARRQAMRDLLYRKDS
jgi:hypothetical protein